MAIVLNGTTGITAPDISVTAQSTDITTTGDITAVDATLSGGVYLGGTGAANYLDDYEEGTWTPVIAGSSSGGTGSSASTTGLYQKIGSTVHVYGYIENINTTGVTGTNAHIQGIPFVVSSVGVHFPLGSAASQNISYTNTLLIQGRDNASALGIVETSPSVFSLIKISDITSGSASIYFSLTYTTSA